MKIKSLSLAVLLSVLFVFSAVSEVPGQFSLYLTTDGAYYPESEYRSSNAHMSKITGAYRSVEARTTLHGAYKIPTPLGENGLLRGASLTLDGACEVSPITVRAIGAVAFSPVPFLSFGAGASAGSGWSLLSLEGLSELNKTSQKYESLQPFGHWYYDLWASGTFMFDTGAVIPGDWTHFVISASYKVIYKGMTGLDSDSIWKWQASDSQANGLQYYSSAILAYQMPMKLYRVGFMGEFFGHYKDSDYGDLGKTYNGNFGFVSISPLVQLKFSEKNSVIILTEFSSRRAFEEEHSETRVEPFLTYTGYEWFFRRLVFSWTHNF